MITLSPTDVAEVIRGTPDPYPCPDTARHGNHIHVVTVAGIRMYRHCLGDPLRKAWRRP